MDEINGRLPETKIAVTKTANIGLRVRAIRCNAFPHLLPLTSL